MRAATPLACAALVALCASGCGAGHAANSSRATSSRHHPSTTAGTTSGPAPSATIAAPPAPTCTTVPGAIGPVPDWLPAQFPLPSGTTLVGEQSDGAGGNIGMFTAPNASPAGYTATVTAHLLGAGWTVSSWPEDAAPPDEREVSFAKPPQALAFRINTYTYCGEAAQISVDVIG